MNKNFYKMLGIFIAINILLYCFIVCLNSKAQFNYVNYFLNSHHYFKDQRIEGKGFNLLNALGQYDAQWYLKIAQTGYPFNPSPETLTNKKVMNGLSYAFAPIYPLTLAITNLAFKNIEFSAFLVANILLLLNFGSLYFVISKYYGKNLAFKTIFLLFLFPFSIFYRSFFSEGLFLFLLIWFSYGLLSRRWLLAATTMAFLMLTRFVGIFLFPVFLLYFYKSPKKDKQISKTLLYLLVLLIPFLLWLTFCYIQTGNPFYFLQVRSEWSDMPIPFIHNLRLILAFPFLPVHAFHYSKLDVFTMIMVTIILIASKKKLKPELWWISFLLWLGPFITGDMSFTRYQIVSFPLFLYASQILTNKKYSILITAFAISLFVVSLYFVNWYWIG